MKRLQMLLALVLLIVGSRSAGAQATITFDSGYPAAGSSSGSIVVKGTVTLDMGWNYLDCCGYNVVIRVWKVGSGEQVVAKTGINVSNCPDSWGEYCVEGLESDAEYNVTVEVVVDNGCCCTQTVVSDPKTATAK